MIARKHGYFHMKVRYIEGRIQPPPKSMLNYTHTHTHKTIGYSQQQLTNCSIKVGRHSYQLFYVATLDLQHETLVLTRGVASNLKLVCSAVQHFVPIPIILQG